MNQAFLQQEAKERILDAKVLLDGSRWGYAYYVAGYAVECALKSCLLTRMVYTGWVFQDKVKIDECLTHDFGQLVRLAGLTDELNTKRASSAGSGAIFHFNWDIAIHWKVTSRYESKTEAEARELFDAIVNDPDGVLAWIQKYW